MSQSRSAWALAAGLAVFSSSAFLAGVLFGASGDLGNDLSPLRPAATWRGDLDRQLDLSEADMNLSAEAEGGHNATGPLRQPPARCDPDASLGVVNETAAAAALEALAARSKCGASVRGKKFRSLVCTIVRNDLHLREFLVRNLLVGFCHVVVYDNNRVLVGMDRNITSLLAPFVRQGLVTHVPTGQDGAAALGNNWKNGLTNECVNNYGSQADWVAVMDSDEVIALGDTARGSGFASVGVLDEFLSVVERSSQPTCGLRLFWLNMYGEHRVIQGQGELLMDEFPRILAPYRSWKLLFRPDMAKVWPPHTINCAESGYGVVNKSLEDTADGYKLLYLHYNTKSLQEYITKSEQSIPPYFRLLEQAYEPGACTNAAECLVTVHYTRGYKSLVRRTVQMLRTSQGGLSDGGVLLAPPPESPLNSRPDYNLYVFLKLRVLAEQEWDEDWYLEKYPDVAQAVNETREIEGLQKVRVGLADGLHHFLLNGYRESRRSCWKHNDNRTNCV